MKTRLSSGYNGVKVVLVREGERIEGIAKREGAFLRVGTRLFLHGREVAQTDELLGIELLDGWRIEDGSRDL